MVSFAANETENIGSFSEAASAQLNDFVVNDANGIIDLLAVKVQEFGCVIELINIFKNPVGNFQTYFEPVEIVIFLKDLLILFMSMAALIIRVLKDF